jgi:hypothetical protein
LTILTDAKLAAIDARLLDRLLVACDDAVTRALEKANARIRSAAQGKHNKDALARHSTELAAWMGPDAVTELGLSEDALLAAAFAVLESKFTQWTTDAIGAAVRQAAALLHLPLTTVASLSRTLTSRIPKSWARLQGSLRTRALAALYGKAGTEQRGESPQDVVKAGDIRAALAEIGGQHVDEGGQSPDPLGGIAQGPDITDLIEATAGPAIGMVWQYGPEDRNTFHPHLALDDHRFDGPADVRLTPPPGFEWLGARMRPGDHQGCRCYRTRAWIFPENTSTMAPEVRDALADAAADESPSMRGVRSLAEADDAAGRRGTYAQRQRDERDRILRFRNEWLEASA